MKVKVLSILLGISVLLNIAGLVFFIGFLKLQGNYRAIKKERNAMAQNLTAVRASETISDAIDSGHVVRRTFASLADGQEDTYAVAPPANPGRLDNTLVVYLHGMGSTYLEPFTCPADQTIAQSITAKYPDACILSCSYRKLASWGSDLAMSDITQNIREVMQQYPIKQIVLMGTSMGGCTVLTYAVQAPPDIQRKLTGIVSVEGAGSLKDLFDLTQNADVKNALFLSMGGDYKHAAANYEHKSFLPQIDKLSAPVRVAIISASQDKIVPPELQSRLADALKQHNNPVKLISVDAGHGAPPGAIYVQGLDFALGGA